MTLEQTMRALLALAAADREERVADERAGGARRTELVLSDAGLTAAQIGGVLGKKTNTVAKTISRARGKETA